MDCKEAKELLADSLRCLARSMEQIKLRELEKCIGYDEPMQDHLAECTPPGIHPYGNTSVEDCCRYLMSLYKGFDMASEHEDLVSSKYKLGDYDEAHIADMVMGGINHLFPTDLKACAKEIRKFTDKQVPPSGHHPKSKADYIKKAQKFLAECDKIIEKYDLRTWEKGDYSLPLGYLENWLSRRYWEE
jgi:hypothetical protein